MKHQLIETGSSQFFMSLFDFFLFLFSLFVFLFYFFDLHVGFHIPKAGLLVVIPAEVDKVLNEIHDEIVLGEERGTLVGRMRFCILSLKLNISSYL